ncbi:MAG: RCC1-like domain-containing protein [Nitrospiria bacterium]
MDEKKDRRAHVRVPYHEFSKIQDMPSKSAEVTKPSKFIQISAGDDHLFALDESGEIWSYNQLKNEWDQLSDTRQS